MNKALLGLLYCCSLYAENVQENNVKYRKYNMRNEQDTENLLYIMRYEVCCVFALFICIAAYNKCEDNKNQDMWEFHKTAQICTILNSVMDSYNASDVQDGKSTRYKIDQAFQFAQALSKTIDHKKLQNVDDTRMYQIYEACVGEWKEQYGSKFSTVLRGSSENDELIDEIHRQIITVMLHGMSSVDYISTKLFFGYNPDFTATDCVIILIVLLKNYLMLHAKLLEERHKAKQDAAAFETNTNLDDDKDKYPYNYSFLLRKFDEIVDSANFTMINGKNVMPINLQTMFSMAEPAMLRVMIATD